MKEEKETRGSDTHWIHCGLELESLIGPLAFRLSRGMVRACLRLDSPHLQKLCSTGQHWVFILALAVTFTHLHLIFLSCHLWELIDFMVFRGQEVRIRIKDTIPNLMISITIPQKYQVKTFQEGYTKRVECDSLDAIHTE